MEKEHKCENCKYFNCYYTIFHNSLLKSGGHCVHDKVYSARTKKRFIPRENCEFWEDNSSRTEERRNNILKDLRAMKRRLDDIVKILSIDKK